MSKKLYGYLPVLILFCVSLIIGMLTYQDYGIAWDEIDQREPGVACYNYAVHNDTTIFQYGQDRHGAAFEFFLAAVEKNMNIVKERDIFLMRHIVSHIVFLLAALSFGMAAYRLFGSRFLSCLCFLMLVCMPRIYAHSFFNSKDVPFMALIAVGISVSQLAFSRKKAIWFLLLGMAGGFATSIRIMGILLFAVVCAFIIIDIFTSGDIKKNIAKHTAHLLLFTATFWLTVYISWPFLWRTPVTTFVESVKMMSSFPWQGTVLMGGRAIPSNEIPWYYFPTWFSITIPILWLIAGIGGIGLAIALFIKAPLVSLKNRPERNFLLCLLCFFGPILAVIVFKSVLYDDWRHLYFVYPPFVLLAAYCFSIIFRGKYEMLVKAACVVQVAASVLFMVKYPRFTQVYFNPLASHKEEHLRKNYELDYWGVTYKLALDYLLKAYPNDMIKVSSHGMQRGLLHKNMVLLEQRDKDRIQVTSPEECDYFVTNFRNATNGFPYPKIEYSIKVQNSTVLCIYKTH